MPTEKHKFNCGWQTSPSASYELAHREVCQPQQPNDIFMRNKFLRAKQITVFLFLISLLILFSGCPFRGNRSVKSTFEIASIDSTNFGNYNIIDLRSESGIIYNLLSPKKCQMEGTERTGYKEIKIGDTIKLRIFEFRKYPELEESSSFRTSVVMKYYVLDSNEEDVLFWSEGKYYRKAYYSPEICDVFLLNKTNE